MIAVSYKPETGVVFVEPKTSLQEADFDQLDTLLQGIRDEGKPFNGIMVHSLHFPGWDTFNDFLAHVDFVKSHRHEVPKVAFVTDSALFDVAETLGNIFTAAEIKQFDFNDIDSAERWLAAT